MDILDITGSISFTSASLILLIIPLLLLLVWELSNRNKSETIAFTDLEYLRSKELISGISRKVIRIALWGLIVVSIGIMWTGPMLHTTSPVFIGGEQLLQKNIMVAIDVSRSMGQPLEVPDKDARFAMFGGAPGEVKPEEETEQKQTRYESARETFYSFVDRFKGARIGLILFSTEPFLARWPTVETDLRFIEVLEEKLGREERSQLQRFSSLTNTHEALNLAGEVFVKQKAVNGGAIVLISDAEDEIENMGVAIKKLRNDGIRIYTIGVGISEIIVEKLSKEFIGDTGFRIFRVDSEDEMQEAYRLVSELEESPRFTNEESEFITDLRWIFAIMIVIITGIVLWSMETVFHQSHITDQEI